VENNKPRLMGSSLMVCGELHTIVFVLLHIINKLADHAICLAIHFLCKGDFTEVSKGVFVEGALQLEVDISAFSV
jgi:hypothetical protein